MGQKASGSFNFQAVHVPLCVLRALLDQTPPPSMLTWSLCATTGEAGIPKTTTAVTWSDRRKQIMVCRSERTEWFTGRLLSLRVRLVERGAPQSLPLMESGTVSIDYWLKRQEDVCDAPTSHRPREVIDVVVLSIKLNSPLYVLT